MHDISLPSQFLFLRFPLRSEPYLLLTDKTFLILPHGRWMQVMVLPGSPAFCLSANVPWLPLRSQSGWGGKRPRSSPSLTPVMERAGQGLMAWLWLEEQQGFGKTLLVEINNVISAPSLCFSYF